MLHMTPAPSLRRLEIVVTTKMTVTTWSDSQLIYCNPLGDGALGILLSPLSKQARPSRQCCS